MRSYSVEFFAIRDKSLSLINHTKKTKQLILDALMLVLTVFEMALQVAHEVTGISMLNLCAEMVDGLYSALEKRDSSSYRP